MSAEIAEVAPKRQRFLIHIERPVDLDLEGVKPVIRSAVALGDIAARVGFIHRDLEPAGMAFRHPNQLPATGGAEAVAQHEIDLGGRAALLRRHGMAIEEAGDAEIGTRPLDQPGQRGMIGLDTGG